jgi:hypothetical protein
VVVNDLGFFYLEVHAAWYHTPTSSLIFMHELFNREDDEIHALVFERTGENPSEWLIQRLKYPYDFDLDS